MAESDEVGLVEHDKESSAGRVIQKKLLSLTSLTSSFIDDLMPDIFNPDAEPILPHGLVSLNLSLHGGELLLPQDVNSDDHPEYKESNPKRSDKLMKVLETLLQDVPTESSAVKDVAQITQPETVKTLRTVELLLNENMLSWMMKSNESIFDEFTDLATNNSLPDFFTSQIEMKKIRRSSKFPQTSQTYETSLRSTYSENGEKTFRIYANDSSRDTFTLIYNYNPELPLQDVFSTIEKANETFIYSI